MKKSARFAALAVVSGLAAAAFTTEATGPRAEGALEFFVNQYARQRAPERVRPQDYDQQRYGRGGSVFGGLFEFFEEPAPVKRRVAAPNLQRAVCKRQCDGAQIVLGFVPENSRGKDIEAMCTAAGGGAQTELVMEKFVPGQGFDHAPVQTASAAPLLEGRASLGGSSQPKELPSPCPQNARAEAFMAVPLLHDATLRNGDVVATRDGFKVFVGSGKPPFKDGDFVPLESRKRVSADLKKLKVADR